MYPTSLTRRTGAFPATASTYKNKNRVPSYTQCVLRVSPPTRPFLLLATDATLVLVVFEVVEQLLGFVNLLLLTVDFLLLFRHFLLQLL